MKVNYDVTLPSIVTRGEIEEQKFIQEFIEKSSKTMSIGYDSTKEAGLRAVSIRNWLKKREINIQCIQRTDTVYLIKPEA